MKRNKVLVVAPHPDDETLGCGGTLLKHRQQGDQIHWLIFTQMIGLSGVTEERIQTREREIEQVVEAYGFQSVEHFDYPTTKLDTFPLDIIIRDISEVLNRIQPEIIYLPYRGDIHSDHRVVFDSVVACGKWFRYPFIQKILVYETLSETDFALNPDLIGFRPNVFVNIENFLQNKIEIMNIFQSEISDFPFPRSNEAIRALAQYRGQMSGFKAAEAFMLLKETII